MPKKEFPIPTKGQAPAEFIMEQAKKIVQQQMPEPTLQSRVVEMFTKPDPIMKIQEGDDLYLLDIIVDVWPEDEHRGKSGKLVEEIIAGKLRDYLRIYDDYEFTNDGDWAYDPYGGMRIIFHFKKRKDGQQ